MRTTSEPLRKAMYVASQLARAGFRGKDVVRAKLEILSISRTHLWRARCITKGARRVRKGAPGNLPARAGKAPGAYLTPQGAQSHIGCTRREYGRAREFRSEGTPRSPSPRSAARDRLARRVRETKPSGPPPCGRGPSPRADGARNEGLGKGTYERRLGSSRRAPQRAACRANPPCIAAHFRGRWVV